jgi:hypothetical protein
MKNMYLNWAVVWESYILSTSCIVSISCRKGLKTIFKWTNPTGLKFHNDVFDDNTRKVWKNIALHWPVVCLLTQLTEIPPAQLSPASTRPSFRQFRHYLRRTFTVNCKRFNEALGNGLSANQIQVLAGLAMSIAVNAGL